MLLKPKEHTSYFYPFLIAILLRLGMIPFLGYSESSLMEYGQIARNMLQGSGYSYSWYHTNGTTVVLPSAYMPPGQVFIQYAMLGIFGDSSLGIIALYLFQIVQFVFFIYFIGKISFLLFGSEKIEKYTIWLAAIYPPFIYMTMTFGVTTSALLLNSIILYLAIRFSEVLRTGNKRRKLALLFGISCGALLLFRGEAPAIIFSTFLYIVYRNRATLRQSLLFSGFAAIIAIAILAPWTIRNYVVLGRFIPISTNGGFNFWRGNNALTTGSPWTETGAPLWTTDEIWAELEPKLDSVKDFDKENSDTHSREAFRWIKEHPAQAAVLSLKKAAILWTVDIRSRMGGTIAYISMYLLTLLSLFAGIYFIRKNKISHANPDAKTGFQLMILWCIMATIVSMIFFPLPRFQILLIGIYFPVAGYGVSEIAARLFGRKLPA
jgi:hypothetical protein